MSDDGKLSVVPLAEEATAFPGAMPSGRHERRRDQRHGHTTRDVETHVGRRTDVPIPRVRVGHQTPVVGRSYRRHDEQDGAIGAMFVKAGLWIGDGKQWDQGEPELTALLDRNIRQKADQAGAAFIETDQRFFPQPLSASSITWRQV